MASFLDITESTPREGRRFLRRDWSAVEKAFHDGLPAFTESIGVMCGMKADKKNEENQTKTQEQQVGNVEYVNVEVPKEGASASQPAQPKEQYLSTPSDAFDDIFGTPTPAKLSKVAVAPTQVPVVSQPEASTAVPDANEDDPFVHGFDFVKFSEVRKIAEGILYKASHKIDLDNLDQEYKEYAVEYSIDAYRANADILSEHMANTQSKKDRVNTILIELTSLKESYNATEDMYESFGILCSNASSKEKRIAQVRYQLKDFYTQLAHVERLHAMYEQVEKGLNRQIETLSRLLGIHLARRPGMPFEQDLRKMDDVSQPVVSRRMETRDACRPASKRGLDGLDDFEPNPVIPKDINRGTEEVDF